MNHKTKRRQAKEPQSITELGWGLKHKPKSKIGGAIPDHIIFDEVDALGSAIEIGEISQIVEIPQDILTGNQRRIVSNIHYSYSSTSYIQPYWDTSITTPPIHLTYLTDQVKTFILESDCSKCKYFDSDHLGCQLNFFRMPIYFNSFTNKFVMGHYFYHIDFAYNKNCKKYCPSQDYLNWQEQVQCLKELQYLNGKMEKITQTDLIL